MTLLLTPLNSLKKAPNNLASRYTQIIIFWLGATRGRLGRDFGPGKIQIHQP